MSTLTILGWAFSTKFENSNQKLIAIAMGECPGQDGGVIETGYDFLAEFGLMSRADVEREVGNMVKSGFLAPAPKPSWETEDSAYFFPLGA